MNFTVDIFRHFCQKINLEIAYNIILSPPEQWLDGSMDNICKMHNQKCLDTNNAINLALLQIRSTAIGAGLPSPTTLLFNRPIRGLLLQMNRVPIKINNDNPQYEAPQACQDKYVKKSDTYKESLSLFLYGLQQPCSVKMGNNGHMESLWMLATTTTDRNPT